MADGMDALRARVERGSRVVPPSRRPRPPLADRPTAESGGVPAEETPAPLEAPESGGVAEPEQVADTQPEASEVEAAAPGGIEEAPYAPASVEQLPRQPAEAARPYLPGPAEPLANLNVRVRVSLNERVDDLVYELRKQGVRTSKAELVEALLASLPPHPTAALTENLTAFRRMAPRGG